MIQSEQNEEFPSVLVVEDDPIYMKYMLVLMQKIKIKYVSAMTIDEALKVRRNYNLNCMLLDIDTGDGSSGIRLMKEFRMNERFRDIPIIAVSSSYRDGKRKELIEKGFTDYLAKPVYLDHLNQILEKYNIKCRKNTPFTQLPNPCEEN